MGDVLGASSGRMGTGRLPIVEDPESAIKDGNIDYR